MYSLPIKEEDFTKAVSDPEAHSGKNKHAVDFDLPVGSPILAAQDGTVIEVYMESDEGGEDEKYRNNVNKYTNRITIKHTENEYSQYAHLKHKSNEVAVGDKVERGEVIAKSGNTGFSTQPHLHFHVMHLIDDGNDWESLAIQWEKDFEVLGKE